MGAKTKISWSQEQRLRFLERQLLWGRELKAGMIQKAFGVSRYQAGLDIKAYQELKPGNLKPYSPADRCYKPAADFIPYLSTPNAKELLNVVKEGGGGSSLEVVPELTRTIPDGVLPVVLTALECKESIEVLYASASKPQGRLRILIPSAIAYVDNRLHIRAYCCNRLGYRDFVLSRFLEVPKFVDKPSDITLPRDDSWETFVTIKLIANPALPMEGITLIEREFQIDGVKPVQVRASLVHYYLQANLLPHSEMQIEQSQDKPWSFPVVIMNWDQIKSLTLS